MSHFSAALFVYNQVVSWHWKSLHTTTGASRYSTLIIFFPLSSWRDTHFHPSPIVLLNVYLFSLCQPYFLWFLALLLTSWEEKAAGKYDVFGLVNNTLFLMCISRVLNTKKVEVSITFTYRYYGMKKTTTSTVPAGKVLPPTSNGNAAAKKVVAKPIITVTEFTPGNTPTDKVSISIEPPPKLLSKQGIRQMGNCNPGNFWPPAGAPFTLASRERCLLSHFIFRLTKMDATRKKSKGW